MPAYTNLRTFVNALKSGKTNITNRLDAFFANPANVTGNVYWSQFQDLTQDWSAEPPGWLADFLHGRQGNGISGLSSEEADHVMHWPPAELQRTRLAALEAVNAGQPITFFWGLYDGEVPQAVVRTGGTGGREVLFQSPGSSLRLTALNYGEIYVEEV